MRPVVRNVLRFVECVALGLWIAIMPPVLAGGTYEVVTGGPSDGFLFFGMIFILPWMAAVFAVVPVSCWKVRAFRLLCRWFSIMLFAWLISIWCLQAMRDRS
jgi:hypothetical protein